ncbi:MAG: hypothetical protein ACK55I_34280, partial [bacterium]
MGGSGGGEPAGQCQPIRRLVGRQRSKHRRHGSGHRFGRLIILPSTQDLSRARCCLILHHHDQW